MVRTIYGFSVGVLIARHIPRADRGKNNLAFLAILAVFGMTIAGSPQGEFRALWDAVCVLLIFPMVVYLGTLVDPGSKLRRIATLLGLTSYAIYVLHNPLLSVLNSASRVIGGGTDAVGAGILGIAVLAILVIGGWLVDRYFDMPIRRQLSRIIPKTQA
jgi:peptidoglycan/LPS O-acetylase OafA/YrhL